MIEILSTGAVNSVQDRGRFGYLDVGVGRSGVMDAPALDVANLLVGNGPDAAGIEVSLFPFRLRFHVDGIFAVTGADCPATLNGRTLPSWWAMNARAGDSLIVGLPRKGARAVIAFAGGIEVPMVLGSRSTDLKTAFGGLEGRGLRRGDRLALGMAAMRSLPFEAGYGVDPLELTGPVDASTDAVVVRVLPAAEHDLFEQDSLDRLYGAEWTITNDANRMGYRLSGPELRLARKLELFSHGIMPGTVQVPPSGQPIIQLAEANTCGGYPKFATVIEADLFRLAQAPVGMKIRFVGVNREEAVAALRGQRAVLDDMIQTARLVRKADFVR